MTIEQMESFLKRYNLEVDFDGEEYHVYEKNVRLPAPIASCRYRDVAIDLAMDVIAIREEENVESSQPRP